MKFLDKLLARPQSALPLKAGGLSNLATKARSERWTDQCAAALDTQAENFATHFLTRALGAGDFIVKKIEAEEPVLALFDGASRDVLLYETLHFCLHGISDEVRRLAAAPDVFGTSIYLSNLAFIAAGELGRQYLGQFDVPRHRRERAMHYLQRSGNLKEMTEGLVDVLLSARGRMSIDEWESSSVWDPDIEIHINLRGIAHQAAAASIRDSAEKLAAHYAEKPGPAR